MTYDDARAHLVDIFAQYLPTLINPPEGYSQSEAVADLLARALPAFVDMKAAEPRAVPVDCVLLSGSQLQALLSAVPGDEYLQVCKYLRPEDEHAVSILLVLDWLRAPDANRP